MANLRANKIYGTSGPDANGSALFNGTDYLTASNAAAFRLNQGSGADLTIEAWVYAKSLGTQFTIASLYHTSGNKRSYNLYVNSDGELKFNYSGNGTAGNTSALNAGLFPTNQWIHVAVTHDTSATTVRLFKNGLLGASDTGAHATWYANTDGDFVVGSSLDGFISNLHINKGTCKYTAAFDPYKQPIEVETNTTVLCCNSSTDALNDDKSNTFVQTASGGVKPTSDMPFSRSDAGVVFDGDIKMNSQGVMYFPTGTTEQRGRGRGLVAGGFSADSPQGCRTSIQYTDIQSGGIAQDFGDIITGGGLGNVSAAPFGSSTRSVFAGGYDIPGSTNRDVIEYVTIATTSNGTDFGDISAANRMPSGASNNTRGLIAGGYTNTPINTIEYVTIATTGNAADYGDLTGTSRYGMGCASPTRGIFNLGGHPSTSNVINYVTIATTGNASDFGDLTFVTVFTGAATSSDTRGLIAGTYSAPGALNNIDYLTIATTGNAADFGDLTTGLGQGGCGLSNNTRAVWAGMWAQSGKDGRDNQGAGTWMDYVTIATTGDAVSWGDLLEATYYAYGISDSHGGID